MIPNIAVILTNANRRILWVNDDFTHITGYTLPEVVGKSPGGILQGPKTEPEAVNQIRQGLISELPFRGEITNYRKNGEEYLCRLVIHPVYNEQHQLTNFIAFEVDGNAVQEELPIPLLDLEEKYSSSSLKGVDELRLYLRMKDTVEKEQLFLDPNLSLRSVADQLGTNTKYLSQVVNHNAKCNFQQFINQYRVAEVKEKIKDPKYYNLTLFGIARQCGFKNKSTFYKVFKEVTGMTPRKFLKQ
ncbi:MAG: helix-turn-helix domain-containing protein [Mameliella sp.]|nr:helix-turn-helix domain-containing protein [Phaeodactylibacter sp.]NRA50647.1 helix-turn-helix domain-containing protein [Phaeodactylibacter sp.]